MSRSAVSGAPSYRVPTVGTVRRAAWRSVLVCLLFTTMLSTPPRIEAASNREQAIARALQQAGGDARVLGVTERRDDGGQLVYEVKVISDGRVRVISIPAD